MRICYKYLRIMAPKLANFNKEMLPGDNAFSHLPGILMKLDILTKSCIINQVLRLSVCLNTNNEKV